MSTLKELIYYCSEDSPLGAVLLTGEFGCGKTYLIENGLADALQSTHLIVRVSLFGLNSIDAVNEAVHRQWLYVCMPLLGKLKKRRERLKKDTAFFTALNAALRNINPAAGNVATAMVAVDPLDLVPITPIVEDLYSGEKKHVVLIFDDLERTRLDTVEILGCINDYCENMKFSTIVIANEDFILSKAQEDSMAFRIMKEKVIAHKILYEPDFPEIVHAVVTGNTWQSEPYAAFLSENEEMILDAFALHPEADEATLAKPHNIRSLICALKQFYRVYIHLDHHQIPHPEQYLYSFIVYTLVAKSGYVKDGQVCNEIDEKDIALLYPHYSSETMPPSVRKWIEYGIWNREAFESDVCGKN